MNDNKESFNENLFSSRRTRMETNSVQQLTKLESCSHKKNETLKTMTMTVSQLVL